MDASLSLREMEVLHAVVKTGSMSGAGRQLGISQPAVSQLVSAAERRLAVALFVREGNRLRPTAELMELNSELELVFSNVESARRLGALLNQGAGRLVRIGATPSMAAAFLPGAIAELSRSFAHLKALVRIQDPSPIKSAIIARDFDIGLVYAETQREGLDMVDLCRVEMVCFLPPGDPLAAEPVMTPRLLDDRPLISFSHVSRMGEDLDAMFAAEGARRNVIVQTGNSVTSADFVAGGLGIALTDPFILGSPLSQGLTVRPFAPSRPLVPRIVTMKGRRLSQVEEAAIGLLKDTAACWLGRHAERWQRCRKGASSMTAI